MGIDTCCTDARTSGALVKISKSSRGASRRDCIPHVHVTHDVNTPDRLRHVDLSPSTTALFV